MKAQRSARVGSRDSKQVCVQWRGRHQKRRRQRGRGWLRLCPCTPPAFSQHSVHPESSHRLPPLQDRIVLFRPEANAERMAEGAARLSMCPPPKELFLEAVCKVGWAWIGAALGWAARAFSTNVCCMMRSLCC